MTPSRTNYRWVICALLFLATTINYIDRQILSLVKPILDQQLGWTNTQFGLVNSAFQGAYAVGLLGFGWIIDKYGAKIGYGVSIAFWSTAAICHTLVGSITGFGGARVFLGASEAGNFPSAIKAVTLWFPRKERAFATSIFNSGANAGAIVAPAIVPLVVAAWGWRMPFVLAGVAGFIWLFFWIWHFQEPQKHEKISPAELELIQSDHEEGGEAQKVPWIALLGYRQTWSFVAAKFLTDPVWYFFLIWLPDYFNKAKHLNLKGMGGIGLPLVTIYSIVTVLSISGGWLTKFLVQRGWSSNRARKSCMILFALCVTPIFFVSNCGLWGAVCLIGLAASAHQAWSANLYTTVSDMFPKNAVGSVIGMGGMAGSVGGMLFPIFAGWLLDRSDANVGYGILFGICACAYILAFVVNHLLAPRFERADLKLPQQPQVATLR